MMTTIVLELRVFKLYRGLAGLILSRYGLYSSVVWARSHDCRILENCWGLLLWLLLLMLVYLILHMLTVKRLVSGLHVRARNAKDSIGGIGSTLHWVIVVEAVIDRWDVLLWHAARGADQRSLLLSNLRLIPVEHLIIVGNQMVALIANEESTLLGHIGVSWGAGITLTRNSLRLLITSSHCTLLLLRRGGVLGYEVILVLAGWGLLGLCDYRGGWQGLWLLSASCHHWVMLDEAPTWAFVQAGRPCFLWTRSDSGDPLAPKTRKRLLLLESWRMARYLMLLLWSLEGQALVLLRDRHDEVIWNIRLLHHIDVIFV